MTKLKLIGSLVDTIKEQGRYSGFYVAGPKEQQPIGYDYEDKKVLTVSDVEDLSDLPDEDSSYQEGIASGKLVQLSSTSYTNCTYDSDGTKNDYVNKVLLDDINAAAKSVNIVATITTAKTGHNQNVSGSDAVSRHMNGTGVDVAIIDGIGSGGATDASNGSAKFRKLGNKLKDALVLMGYVWNVESGNDKAVLWQTNTGGNHYNHLHISNRTGIS
jgi:hypothetical protein